MTVDCVQATQASTTDTTTLSWVDVCAFNQMATGRGVAALVGTHQVALFRVADDIGENTVFALSNYDPFSRANVLSRGIVGSRGDRLKVASPVYKQNFDLRTGECLDNPAVCVPTFGVRIEGERVLVALPT